MSLHAGSDQERYLIAESIPHLVWVAGPDGAAQYINRRWQAYTGVSVEQAMGWGWQHAIHPEDLPRALDLWRDSLRTGQPYEAEFRLRSIDGEYRWHIDRALPLRDAQGRVTHWFGTCTDIEDQKRAEQAQSWLAAIVESSDDAITSVDSAGRVLTWNPGAERLYGYSAAEMLGRPFFLVVPPELRDEVPPRMARVAQGQGVGPFETVRLRKDGRRIEVSISVAPLRDAGGKVIGGSAITRDITDRKRAEAERDRLLARLQLHIERLPLAYVLLDAGLRIADWNPAAERVFGFRKEEAVGRDPLGLIVPPMSRADVEAVFRRNRDRDMAAHGVHENRTKDGRTITCEWFNTPLVDDQGRFAGMLGLAQDITERKRLEEQLLHSQKMEAVGRLAGGVAHDFNNLLTIINGYAELLLQDLGGDAAGRASARAILEAGERAVRLTQQLLAFSRKDLAAPRTLDLNAAVTEAVAMLRRLIGEDILLTTDLQPGLGRVRADPTHLQQVVMNLAVNARDAMPRGGRLSLATREVQCEPGPHVLLAVTDNGCGMTEEVKAHLFEPFFTTKGVGQGTGLGLSTVYGIVKHSGGHIEVESQAGRGTTFRVYLPRAEDSSQAARPDGAGAVPRGSETILLAEDEDAVRALACQVLRSSGYAVLEASDGAQALWLAGEYREPIDLLVTDVVMPGLDGRGLAERLQALRPGIKALYLSGYTDDAVVRHGVSREEVHFLQKPFSAAGLARKVREVLDHTAAGGASS